MNVSCPVSREYEWHMILVGLMAYLRINEVNMGDFIFILVIILAAYSVYQAYKGDLAEKWFKNGLLLGFLSDNLEDFKKEFRVRTIIILVFIVLLYIFTIVIRLLRR